jgi:hypothetical protein
MGIGGRRKPIVRETRREGQPKCEIVDSWAKCPRRLPSSNIAFTRRRTSAPIACSMFDLFIFELRVETIHGVFRRGAVSANEVMHIRSF